jgi:hypothetical protein
MPGGNGRDEEGPKDIGRDEEGPKDIGRDEEGPKDIGRGARTSGFGGGAGGGWVVVAFISPVGMNVPELAARMLTGSNPRGPSGSRLMPIGKTAVLAQEKARREAKLRDEERKRYERYRQQERVKAAAEDKA